MGMSASQVRFLSLQSRKNRIGSQLLSLSNRKMALSRDMNTVAMRFNDAMNATTLKWSNDTGCTYNTLSYDLMMRPNELCAEKPYIVTDAATGKVVLNNDNLVDIHGNDIGVSYVDIAKMISEYSGVDKSTGKCIYNRDGLVSERLNGADILKGGKESIDNAYYIPSTPHDFNFGNNVRYEIFTKMGIVSEADRQEQLNLLVELYGSEDAQESGIYPVGCAWGDYYLAKANLEAYQEFLANKQSVSSSSTFNSSTDTIDTERINYSTDNYVFMSYVTDRSYEDGWTYIEQDAFSNVKTDSLAHIDFTGYTEKNAAGNFVTTYKYNEDGSVNTSFDDALGSNGDDTLTDTAYTFKTNVSSDGIQYTYSFDDIWHLAKTNALASGADISSCYLDKIGATGDGDLVEVASSSNSSINLENAKTTMRTILQAAKNVLLVNGMVNLDAGILDQAIDKTVETFYKNKKGGYDGSKTRSSKGRNRAISRAKDDARGRNGIGYSRVGGLGSASRAYVDVTCLFNTFLTYYSTLSQGVDLLTRSSGVPSINVPDNDTPTSTMGNWYQDPNSGNDWVNVGLGNLALLKESYYVNESKQFSSSVFTVETVKLSTKSEDSEGDPRECLYVRDNVRAGTQYLYSENMYQYDSATHGSPGDKKKEYLYLYADDTEDVVTETKYTMDTNGVWWDIDGDGNLETKIYGVYETGSDVYYFTSLADAQTAYTNALNSNGSIDLSNAKKYVVPATSPLASIGIDADEDASRYDISIDAYVNDQQNYEATLEERVKAAWDRIERLENSIDTLFSSAECKIMDYYDALFQRIAEQGWVVDDKTSNQRTASNTYLNNKLQNNDYFITECTERDGSTGYNYASKMATSIKKIFAVNDDDAQQTALAQYEEQKSAISRKEKVIDARMQKLETEQESINTMMDSIKKIINDNIKKTFKMFA